MTNAVLLPTPPRFPKVLLPANLPQNPTDIEAAQASGWFSALRRVITELHAEGVLVALSTSGMRGRGNRGVPLGDKWESCARAQADRKYVVVNAFQSDPSVLTDRILLERNPYAVFEGAAIAAFTVGAEEIIFAVRAEATDSIDTLEAAIAVARQAGYLGDNVFGSGWSLEASVRPLEGSYMLGEETVLLKGIEGRRGQPEQQPPYTTTHGLWGKPTLIHGPQTFAAVPTIVNGGNEEFIETSPRAFAGTLLVQITGAVVQPGIAEVPLGVTLNEVLDVAGGIAPGKKLKAVLVGGPTGGLVPPAALNTTFDQGSLEKIGAQIGSGSIVVVDQSACVVDLAATLTRFSADQACGKTIPCRIGLRRMAEIGQRFVDGSPRGDDVTLLYDLASDISESALCDHERRATLALTSLARNFRDELDAHILRNTCPAGVCRPNPKTTATTRAGAAS
jgi:NADH:ubiquinone oxidoreductase subunit F (NADH-binding)